MEKMKFGFIGAGNMGGALASSVCRACGADSVAVADKFPDAANALARANGCHVKTNAEIALEAEYIFLGVKPQMLPELLSEITPVLAVRENRFVLVSMAAGTSIEVLSTMTEGEYPIIRIMPNTPVSAGEGMILYCTSQNVTDADTEGFLDAMRLAGRLDRIDERLIDAASAVSGCGPAFVCLFIEALADGGVECGLPRAKAVEYAAQTLLGTAKLLLETGKHPGSLKDAVCSPAGTTIAGVHTLENGGFRASVMSAVTAAYERTLRLSGN